MLKKDNYDFKGIIINAIAMISSLNITDQSYTTATFDIKQYREGPVLAREIVPFTFVRTENPMETAYNTAKSNHAIMVYDPEQEKEVEILVPNSIFTGWEDVIVE